MDQLTEIRPWVLTGELTEWHIVSDEPLQDSDFGFVSWHDHLSITL